MLLSSVMIIDDNEADRYILRRLLRRGKLAEHIFEVADGDEALAFFKNRAEQERLHPGYFPPIVVFLDINMPRVGGFEFLERFQKLRQDLGYESVVFLMVSSSERDEDRERGLSYEFVKGFITKMPSNAGALKSSVVEAMGLEED